MKGIIAREIDKFIGEHTFTDAEENDVVELLHYLTADRPVIDEVDYSDDDDRNYYYRRLMVFGSFEGVELHSQRGVRWIGEAECRAILYQRLRWRRNELERLQSEVQKLERALGGSYS